ncbi:MAG: hypothetical protein ACYCWW_11870 [Deltaproteobacteria bacterium]
MSSSRQRPAILSLFGCSFALLLAAGARADDPHHRGKHKSREHAAAHHKAAHRERGHGRVEGTIPTSVAPRPKEPAPEVMSTRGPTRLDFDDRLVQGQSNKAGAIFLYDRKSLPLSSMVREKERFRREIEEQLPAEAEGLE